MKNKNKNTLNQSIPDEFSSNYINYKVEHNPNFHYNYNPAEITAMREEKIREEQENKKRKQISDCITQCKKNIIKYNQEKQNETEKVNESISSIQRGKEYNENLRKQMKLKAEMKKNKKKNNNINNNEKELNDNNYEEEVMTTFSFKESKQIDGDNVDIDGNRYNEFYNNNINDNLQIKDLSHNIASQIQDNSYNSSPFVSKTLASNFYLKNSNNDNYNINNVNNNINPTNLLNNNLFNNNQNINFNSKKDINIQQQINNNIQLIQKFRQTGSLSEAVENNLNNIENNNYFINNQNVPLPQPIIKAGTMPPKMTNINAFENKNQIQEQDFNINDISSIKSGVNYSTHLQTNNSNNDNIIQQNKYSKNKNNSNKYKSPYEMNELQQKRYKKALRKLVIDRFNSKKIDIPSICSCGQLQRKIDSLLNENKLITQNDLMNVDCANNCIYYQKPGSYHRALTDIIQSIRTLQLENGIRK